MLPPSSKSSKTTPAGCRGVGSTAGSPLRERVPTPADNQGRNGKGELIVTSEVLPEKKAQKVAPAGVADFGEAKGQQRIETGKRPATVAFGQPTPSVVRMSWWRQVKATMPSAISADAPRVCGSTPLPLPHAHWSFFLRFAKQRPHRGAEIISFTD